MKIKIRGKRQKKRLLEDMETKALERIGSTQVDKLDQMLAALENVDISIDQLVAFLAGVDPVTMQMRQTILKRAPIPGKKGPQKGAADEVDKEYVNEDKISVKLLQKIIQEEIERIAFKEGCGIPTEPLPDMIEEPLKKKESLSEF